MTYLDCHDDERDLVERVPQRQVVILSVSKVWVFHAGMLYSFAKGLLILVPGQLIRGPCGPRMSLIKNTMYPLQLVDVLDGE